MDEAGTCSEAQVRRLAKDVGLGLRRRGPAYALVQGGPPSMLGPEVGAVIWPLVYAGRDERDPDPAKSGFAAGATLQDAAQYLAEAVAMLDAAEQEDHEDSEEEPLDAEEAQARLSAWLGVHDPQPGAEATEVLTAEYLVTVRCVNHLPYSAEEWPEPTRDQLADREALGGDSACDGLAMAVEARSAVEALYKAADAVGYRLPVRRADICPLFACEYDILVSCEYASDTIRAGGEADSAFRALVDAVGFDSAMREHRADEW